MDLKALYFVDMPFGQKPDLKSGVIVDFDQICCEAIKHTTCRWKAEASRFTLAISTGIIPA